MRYVCALLLLPFFGCNTEEEGIPCTPANHCDDSSGDPRCEPRFTWEDPADETNHRCVAIPRYDPCDPNPCTVVGRSTCVVSGGTRYCECDEGYHLEGFDCVPNDACFGVACSNRGTCVIAAEQATCACERYYVANGLSCVFADALDALPTTCGRSGIPTLVWEDVADAGESPVAPLAGMPQEPAILVTPTGEVLIAFQSAGATPHLTLASRGPSDVLWNLEPAFGADFNGFASDLAVTEGVLFMAATGATGTGDIDQVKASVREVGIWQPYDLALNSVGQTGFGRLDIGTNDAGNAVIAARRAYSIGTPDAGWVSDSFAYLGGSFSPYGETSFLCGADAGVALGADDDLWSVCVRMDVADGMNESVRVSQYGGSFWLHWDIDDASHVEPWRNYLDADVDVLDRLHILYEGLDTDDLPEAAYAIFDLIKDRIHYARFSLDFTSEESDFSDGGATLVLDDDGCPIIIGREAGSQELTYVAPRDQADWEIETLGINSATRVDAVWANGALHLVVVDPDSDVVRYARANWE